MKALSLIIITVLAYLYARGPYETPKNPCSCIEAPVYENRVPLSPEEFRRQSDEGRYPSLNKDHAVLRPSDRLSSEDY